METSLPLFRTSRRSLASCTGFSLVELLVTLAIVAVLAVLGVKALQSVQAKARATNCTSNLRQIGMAMHAYASDHRGMIDLIAYKGAGTSVPWSRFLTGRVDEAYNRAPVGTATAYLTDASVTCCPALAPFRNTQESDFCYGAGAEGIRDPFSRIPEGIPGLRVPSRQVSLRTIDNPSEYWLLADSYERNQLKQFWVITPDLSRNYGIQLRHAGRANVLFADGHVEAADGERLRSLPHNPFTQGFDAKGQVITF